MEKHTRRNRVTPFGAFEASAAKGKLMGNRGDLHDSEGNIARSWKVRRWISCALVHPSGSRVVFDKPGRYTPLFFADEATAFAAGHRPCSECRRADYEAYREGWRLALGVTPKAEDMDKALHEARMDAAGNKLTFKARFAELPDGVFVVDPKDTGRALLKYANALHPWSHEGYGPPREAAGDQIYDVLTPRPTVEVIRALGASSPFAVSAPRIA